MDAFFVSVEELFDPSLKGKPVVVGGQANERGVVSAASYAARKFGVHSAMPLRTAYQKCPQAIFVDGHPDRYREYSHKVYEVLESFSPLVEMASVDEAYLDITGTERLYGPPLRAAHLLHERMKAATKLNCSIGIAASRLVAKITSDQAKPNGILWVLPGREAAFLAPLDVRKVPGVGKVTEKNLHLLGIRKVGDLAQLDDGFLEERFGKWGMALAGKSRGLDAGGWFDTEIGEDAGTEIDQPRAHVQRRHGRTWSRSNRRWRGYRRWWDGVCGSTGWRRGRSSSSCATRISRRSRARIRCRAPRSSIRRSTRRSANCFAGTGRPARRCGCSACTLRDGRKAASRWICWAKIVIRSGRRRWRQPTGCAIVSARRPCRWPRVCAGSSAERTHENPVGLPGKPSKNPSK